MLVHVLTTKVWCSVEKSQARGPAVEARSRTTTAIEQQEALWSSYRIGGRKGRKKEAWGREGGEAWPDIVRTGDTAAWLLEKEISVERMSKMEARSPTGPELDAICLKMNMIGFMPAKELSKQQRRLDLASGGE